MAPSGIRSLFAGASHLTDHDEEEQLTGFATLVEDNLKCPFKTTVLGSR
jgi:hypothetical protein